MKTAAVTSAHTPSTPLTWTAIVGLHLLSTIGCSRPPSSGSGAPAPAPSAGPATAPVPAMAPATRAAAELTVAVTDLRNHKGQLIFGVFRTADGFPTVEGKAVYWEVRAADAPSQTFTAHLPPGRYAASVLHDESKSGDMDKNIAGIPKEGYGVTNNPKPTLRAATFEEATFDLPEEGAAKSISVQYF